MSFIKWVGGKSQIVYDLLDRFPANINNYIEPFLGGGSVLIALLRKLELNKIKINGKIYCSDTNQNLINCFNHIKHNILELLDYLDELAQLNLMNDDISTSKEIPNNIKDAAIQGNDTLYYFIRNQYNQNNINPIKKSAMLIFLNKTCFRGLYRVGKNGFNVPYGNYKNPKIHDRGYLMELSKLFKKYDVQFDCANFNDYVYKKMEQNDFCYLDPPYYPLDEKSFVNYTIDGFSLEDNNDLILLCMNIDMMGNKFLLSNSDTEYIKSSLEQFDIDTIKCKRAINCKNPNSVVNEVLIKNF
jgi:DNA adenine methylase